MRDHIIAEIERNKLVAIVRGVKTEDLIPLAEAMYDGGVRLLEITYDPSGRISDADTAKNIALLAEHFEKKMLIGAGTVLTEAQVALTKSAGGCFIISPDTYGAVIEKTRALEMVSMPGALTPSEIQQAHRCGADFVKLFPITNLGVDYVKAVKAPLSHIKFLAVGGVTAENMAQYLQAGVSGFGIGSDLVDKKAIQSKDFARITALAKTYAEVLSR